MFSGSSHDQPSSKDLTWKHSRRQETHKISKEAMRKLEVAAAVNWLGRCTERRSADRCGTGHRVALRAWMAWALAPNDDEPQRVLLFHFGWTKFETSSKQQSNSKFHRLKGLTCPSCVPQVFRRVLVELVHRPPLRGGLQGHPDGADGAARRALRQPPVETIGGGLELVTFGNHFFKTLKSHIDFT